MRLVLIAVLVVLLIVALLFAAGNYFGLVGRGPQGPQGPQGPAGPVGPSGPPGPAGPTVVVYATPVPPTPTPVPPTITPVAPTAAPEPTRPAPTSALASSQPQTCGLIFPAYSGGVVNTVYDIRVDCWQEASTWKLRGWQFRLPQNRSAHSVAIQLPRGNYTFNGVVCRLFLDEQRNGRGSANPMVAGNGNNLAFTVSVDVAWALVECDGGPSSGFDYWSR